MNKINKEIGKLNNLQHGESSHYLTDFKQKAGLVTMEEIRSLEPKNIEEMNKKIALIDRYAMAQQKLVDVFGSVNGRVINAINQNVDLQARLWEYEENFIKKKELAKSRITEIEQEMTTTEEQNKLSALKKELFGLKMLVVSDIIEDMTWQNLRKQLATETQFIHKFGLDVADVQARNEARKSKRGEDIIFTVDENIQNDST